MSADTKDAEKTYLARAGTIGWELAKPFSPAGSDTLDDSARMLHDFALALLMLQPSPDDMILDLGAGACWCSDLLGRLNRSAVAVDISFDMLAAGRTRPGTAIRAVTGDMEKLPFRAGVFQKAVCLSAIHHVPSIPAAVREIARVLDGTGVVLFSEPGRGHAEAPVATAAMQDFGVLEQDVLVGDFVLACRDAGFQDVRVKPLAYTVPGFDLTLEQWESWTRLASSKRPRRALQRIGLACVELLGWGKGGLLFEETLALSTVRALRPLVERHPIIVARKSPATEQRPARWLADLQVDIGERGRANGSTPVTIRATNVGSSPWRPSSRSGIGYVSCGVQLLDAGLRLVVRDYHRELLSHVVAPGETVTMTFECPMPREPGEYGLKFDLVVEGVTWFGANGSAAVSRRIQVTP